MDLIKIGIYLSQKRKSQGFTQEELANRLGISRQAVSKWENGASLPDLELLMTLSNLYRVSINDILEANVGDTFIQSYDRDIQANRNAWNNKAQEWNNYANFSFEVFEYGGDKRYENEEDLQILGDVKGKRVLELGCGGAYNSIVLAKQGAKVSGLDLSEEQLKQAQMNSKDHHVDIELVQGSMDCLNMFMDNSFDIVIAICSISYVKDMKKVFREVERVLKHNGIFLYSTPHPIYDVPLDNQFNDKDSCQISYFEEWENRFKWRPEDKYEFIEYIRPLSSYINALAEANLFIERLEELKPVHAIKTNNELWTRVPEYMVMKARKNS